MNITPQMNPALRFGQLNANLSRIVTSTTRGNWPIICDDLETTAREINEQRKKIIEIATSTEGDQAANANANSGSHRAMAAPQKMLEIYECQLARFILGTNNQSDGMEQLSTASKNVALKIFRMIETLPYYTPIKGGVVDNAFMQKLDVLLEM